MIIGFRTEGSLSLKPGHYTYKATYRELEARRWTQEQRKSLPYDVWTKPLSSNTVTIEVISNASTKREGPTTKRHH